MASYRLLIALFLFCLSLTCTLAAEVPCPFNERDCKCIKIDGTKNPNEFFSVECQSASGLPTFAVPPQPQKRYTVEIFAIAETDISTIPADYFAAFERIENLLLEQKESRSGVQANWHGQAFSNVVISGIDISGLDGMLPLPQALRTLGSNNLKSLTVDGIKTAALVDDSTFANWFPALNKLSISNTRLTSISRRAFVGMPELTTLTLDGLGLNSATVPTTFDGILKLTKLDLNNNGLSQLPLGSFSTLKELTSLSLSGNPLAAAINRGELDNLPAKLKVLSLNNIGINSVPRRIFKNLPELNTVALGGNQIQELTNEDFKEASSLSSILLSGNPIIKIANEVFTPLMYLRYLVLTKTAFSTLDLSWFSSVQYKAPNSQPTIELSNSDQLKNLVIGTAGDKFPAKATIQLTKTGLETIDPKLNDFLNRVPGVNIDLSRNVNLQCDKLAWMAKIECPQRVQINGVTCADKQKQSLEEYLKSVDSNSKCTTKAVDPTTEPPTTQSPASQPPASPTTKGTETIVASFSLTAFLSMLVLWLLI